MFLCPSCRCVTCNLACGSSWSPVLQVCVISGAQQEAAAHTVRAPSSKISPVFNERFHTLPLTSQPPNCCWISGWNACGWSGLRFSGSFFIKPLIYGGKWESKGESRVRNQSGGVIEPVIVTVDAATSLCAMTGVRYQILKPKHFDFEVINNQVCIYRFVNSFMDSAAWMKTWKHSANPQTCTDILKGRGGRKCI